VNPQTRFTERLRLHQTASGQTLADLQIPDQVAGTGVDFVQGWVTGIDADAQTVRIDDAYTLRYDNLIYALGSVADTETVPGVDEFAYTLNSAHDATLLADIWTDSPTAPSSWQAADSPASSPRPRSPSSIPNSTSCC